MGSAQADVSGVRYLEEEAGRMTNERTRTSPDIVESQLSDTRVQLEEKRERLANATSSTEDGDLGQL